MVTGASSGIGRAIAKGVAGAGASVVAVARRGSKLAELEAEITQEEEVEILSLPRDVTDVERIPAWVDEAWSWHDGIDLLVNCAGRTSRAGPFEVTPEEWDHVFDVNLRGAFFLSREIARRMLQNNGGSIVNIASISGLVSDGAQVAYSASKAGIIRMTGVLADLLAPRVRVNAVSPGWVMTKMTEAFLAEPTNLADVIARTKLGRVAQPDEVVGAVIFLGSEMSTFMTGHNLVVDGGWTC